MREQNPKRHHYVVETKRVGQVSDFKFAAMELTYTGAEQVAKKLTKENDNLEVRIIEKRLVWRNY